MTAFLVDEMFPMAAAVILRDTYGHDALHDAEVGLRGADDAQVAAAARADGRAKPCTPVRIWAPPLGLAR